MAHTGIHINEKTPTRVSEGLLRCRALDALAHFDAGHLERLVGIYNTETSEDAQRGGDVSRLGAKQKVLRQLEHIGEPALRYAEQVSHRSHGTRKGGRIKHGRRGIVSYARAERFRSIPADSIGNRRVRPKGDSIEDRYGDRTPFALHMVINLTPNNRVAQVDLEMVGAVPFEQAQRSYAGRGDAVDLSTRANLVGIEEREGAYLTVVLADNKGSVGPVGRFWLMVAIWRGPHLLFPCFMGLMTYAKKPSLG